MDTSESDSDRTEPKAKSATPKKRRLIRGEVTKDEKPKHRAQHYRTDWESAPEFQKWLQPDRSDKLKAKCKVCNTSFKAEITVLKNHGKSKHHKERMKGTVVNQPGIQTFFHDSMNTSKKSPQYLAKVAEVKIAAVFAEHNLAFSLADHLGSVLKDCFPDSKIAGEINVKRKKMTNIVVNAIGGSHKDTVAKVLCNQKFSVLTDESTDVSSVKTACIVVRYFEKDKLQITSKFWELHEVFSKDDSKTVNEGATANNLFKSIMDSFKNYNIPSENIVGFGSDGCSVMMGNKNSVSTRFKEVCPGIVVIKCICHSAHLCASEACKTLPRRCEDLARDIYNFLKCSAKRQAVLVQFQTFLDLKPHKMLHPAQTRWLSLVAVVERILEQWEALLLFFTDMSLSEHILSADHILALLRDPFIKMYYLFLQWILPKFTTLNAYFQSSKVAVTELNAKISELYRDILLCYMDRQYVMQSDISQIDPTKKEKHIKNAQLYLGVGVQSYSNKSEITARPDLCDEFYNRCRTFMQVACTEVKKRWDFNDPVLSKIGILNPKRALSLVTREMAPSIAPLATLLPRVVPSNGQRLLQDLDDQWRKLPLVEFPEAIAKEEQTDIFWGKLHAFENPFGEKEFATLSEFAINALCLPHSNADCERVFSKVNLTKNKTRNRLNTDTINGTLLASQCVNETPGQCTKFTLSDDMIARMATCSLYKHKALLQSGSSNAEGEDKS